MMTKTEAMANLKRLATKAYRVQDACNLRGVVAAFDNDINCLAESLEVIKGSGVNTDEVNTHPICVLFADKIGHLTGHQAIGGDAISEAYKWVIAEMER